MHANPRPSGFWQSVRQLPDRIPLRTKLITAVLGLVAIALLIISVAGLSFLRAYLLRTADQQLSSLTNHLGSGQGFVHGFGPEAWVETFVVDGKVQGFQGFDPTGSVPQITPGASWLTSGSPTTVPAQSGPETWRVVAVPNLRVPTLSGKLTTITLVVGIDVTPEYATLGTLTTVDLLVSLAVLVLLGLAGVAVIRRSLRPLTDIEKTAGAIAAGDLTQRVPERDPRTEVGRLGRSLNTMLGHIENAFRAQARSEAAARRSEERMRQFVADASHELRTPLTAIRGFAEYYRQRGGVAGEAVEAEGALTGTADADVVKTALNGTGQLSPADLARIMRRVEQESARMGVLVEDMLLLARLDQQRPLEHTTVDLLALAADAVHDARVVAPDRNINLTVDTGAALLVNGDEVRLRQVVGNLMSNALAHTPDGTPVEAHIRSGNLEEIWAATGTAHTTGYSAEGLASQPVAVLEVTDHGPGLTDEQQVHVFERFYRADQARSTGGTGLGLAIVAALVSAHGGAVWVQSEYGHGAKFSIALPLAPEAIEDPGEGGLADEDAEVQDWYGTPVPEDSADRWETTERPERWMPPAADEAPQADDVSGDFHGATAWPEPTSWSPERSAGSDA